MDPRNSSAVNQSSTTATAAGSAGINISSSAMTELMSRLGLEKDVKLQAATDRKKLEKIMVAELHHMRGELTFEKVALEKENAGGYPETESETRDQQFKARGSATTRR